MKATPSLVFIVAAVCTAALSSYAMAGGHGHHHAPGSHRRMMPDNPMMMPMNPMDHGMTAAERNFFTNEGKAPVQKTSAAPRDRNH
jgi:hypothetical protein